MLDYEWMNCLILTNFDNSKILWRDKRLKKRYKIYKSSELNWDVNKLANSILLKMMFARLLHQSNSLTLHKFINYRQNIYKVLNGSSKFQKPPIDSTKISYTFFCLTFEFTFLLLLICTHQFAYANRICFSLFSKFIIQLS